MLTSCWQPDAHQVGQEGKIRSVEGATQPQRGLAAEECCHHREAARRRGDSGGNAGAGDAKLGQRAGPADKRVRQGGVEEVHCRHHNHGRARIAGAAQRGVADEHQYGQG